MCEDGGVRHGGGGKCGSGKSRELKSPHEYLLDLEFFGRHVLRAHKALG